MPFPLLPRFAIVATAILFLAPASPLSLSAKADDAPKASHETAVLDRVFANWKARHDRVHTLHFTWDCRVTCKKGTGDYSSARTPQTLLETDQVFEQLGAQLWIDGDDRRCIVSTPRYKVPLRNAMDRGRVMSREVVVGNTTSLYVSGTHWQDGISAPRAQPLFGQHYPTPSVSYAINESSVLFLAFRPRDPLVGCRREDFSVVDGDVVVDGMHCTELHRSIKRQDLGGGGWVVPRDETFWVSPVRDDAVVQWRSKSPEFPTLNGKINYKKDKTYGWIPLEWSSDYEGNHLSECRVTAYAINDEIDPAVFSQEFPAVTPAIDQTRRNAAKDLRYYVVQKDGSKRTISAQEFSRLRGR
jgi:hypothetical protein